MEIGLFRSQICIIIWVLYIKRNLFKLFFSVSSSFLFNRVDIVKKKKNYLTWMLWLNCKNNKTVKRPTFTLSLLPSGTSLGVSYSIFFNLCGNHDKGLLLFSFCRWADCDSELLSRFLEITQLAGARNEFQIQYIWVFSLWFSNLKFQMWLLLW